MGQTQSTFRRQHLERLGVAAFAGASLFGGTYVADRALFAFQNSGALANSLMIGACGGVAVFIWKKYCAERDARTREKMIMVAELNHHIRNAVTLLGQSVALPDGPDKLRLIDEAVDRVDRVLTELVPTAGETESPRLFLDDRKPRQIPKPKH